MRQVTLVSFYGRKNKPLADLIQGCSEFILRSPLERLYRPYHIDQIHGTLLGMEKMAGYAEHYNANLWAETSNKVEMDFTQLLHVLGEHLPMAVQFGGFPRSFTGFESFGRSPYERSFQIQWKTGRFTLVGWPHKDGNFTTRRYLNELRDEIERKCNIRHKYREDNDLFMVLGEIVLPGSMAEEERARFKDISLTIEMAVRDYIVDNKIDVNIDVDAVSVVQYDVETLSLESTVSHRVTDPKMSPDFIEDLYIE